jgi:hypothetical protein
MHMIVLKYTCSKEKFVCFLQRIKPKFYHEYIRKKIDIARSVGMITMVYYPNLLYLWITKLYLRPNSDHMIYLRIAGLKRGLRGFHFLQDVFLGFHVLLLVQ